MPNSDEVEEKDRGKELYLGIIQKEDGNIVRRVHLDVGSSFQENYQLLL